MCAQDVELVGRKARTRQRELRAAPPASTELDGVRREFEELGLTPPEARVLVALLMLGSATSADLARTAGLPRPSVYALLEALTAKGLAEALPGKVATWASRGREESVDRLCALQRERLEYVEQRAERAREAMARALPEGAPVGLPFVHLIHGKAQVNRIYDRLVSEAAVEVLQFAKPPFTWSPSKVNPANLSALRRIRSGRSLYEAPELESAEAELNRRQVSAYVRAGLQVRVVDSALPMKLNVFDRKVALAGISDPAAEPGTYPTFMLIQHAGYAEFCADAFEQQWARARPWAPPAATGG